MGNPDNNSGDLVPGTLDMLVLQALSREEKHGYAIAEYLHQRSEDVLRVEEGALYPALHRLELRGLLASTWGVSENNRRAKFYRLTAAGRKALSDERAHWRRMAGAIARVMGNRLNLRCVELVGSTHLPRIRARVPLLPYSLSFVYPGL